MKEKGSKQEIILFCPFSKMFIFCFLTHWSPYPSNQTLDTNKAYIAWHKAHGVFEGNFWKNGYLWGPAIPLIRDECVLTHSHLPPFLQVILFF